MSLRQWVWRRLTLPASPPCSCPAAGLLNPGWSSGNTDHPEWNTHRWWDLQHTHTPVKDGTNLRCCLHIQNKSWNIPFISFLRQWCNQLFPTNCQCSPRAAGPSSDRNVSLCHPLIWTPEDIYIKKTNKLLLVHVGLRTELIPVCDLISHPVSSSCCTTFKLLTPSVASSRIWIGSYFLDLVSQHLTVPSMDPEHNKTLVKMILFFYFYICHVDDLNVDSPERITVASSLNCTQFTFCNQK